MVPSYWRGGQPWSSLCEEGEALLTRILKAGPLGLLKTRDHSLSWEGRRLWPNCLDLSMHVHSSLVIELFLQQDKNQNTTQTFPQQMLWKFIRCVSVDDGKSHKSEFSKCYLHPKQNSFFYISPMVIFLVIYYNWYLFHSKSCVQFRCKWRSYDKFIIEIDYKFVFFVCVQEYWFFPSLLCIVLFCGYILLF